VKIRKDDNVLITTGKDRGRTGKVHRVIPDSGQVIVSGINMIKRHQKARGVARQAGIIEREAPLDISNVALLCAKCGRPTRVGYRTLPDGGKERFCKACGEIVGS
jgi:large subunit ribosomal protein L24